MMRRIALAGLVGAALAASPAYAETTTPSTPAATTPPGTTTPAPTAKPKAFYTKLSNRTTFTRWAYTNLPVKARKAPDDLLPEYRFDYGKAPVVARY